MRKRGISPVNYCLNDAMDQNFDQIIIGVNSYNNLEEIINFNLIENKDKIDFTTKDLKLIDPRKWK